MFRDHLILQKRLLLLAELAVCGMHSLGEVAVSGMRDSP